MIADTRLLVAAAGLFLGIVVTLGLHLYIRRGNYRRSPVERDGEDRFGIPAWLRLSVVVASGFSAASLLALVIILLGYDLFRHMQALMGPVSIILALTLFLIERLPASTVGLGRRKHQNPWGQTARPSSV